MSKLFEELNLKFINIEKAIERKKNIVNNSFERQQEILNGHFDTETYSNEFNNQRGILLEQIWSHRNLEIDRVNATPLTDKQTLLAEFQKLKLKNLNFNSESFKYELEKVLVRRLIKKQFSFSRKFSASQLIKYAKILELSEIMKRAKNNIKESLSTSFSMSNQNLEVFRLLIDGGADVSFASSHSHFTPLMWASNYGYLKHVEILLEYGADVNAKDEGTTALINTCVNGYFEIAKLLLEYGADVNAKDKIRNTALLVVDSSNNEFIKLLLDYGADVNIKNRLNSSPLTNASSKGHLEAVKLLLKYGADVNIQVKNGKTALMKAAASGSSEVVKLLLENGANTNAKDKRCKTALMHALAEGHIELVDMLQRKRTD